MKPEELLPPEILQKATLNGREYCWPLSEIPSLIEAARRASLLNLGGNLQFRLPPDGSICDCYWIQVDLRWPDTMPWAKEVEYVAAESQKAYADLCRTKDFVAEGRKAFDPYFKEYEKSGGSLTDTMCFVWYLQARPKLRWISDLFRR